LLNDFLDSSERAVYFYATYELSWKIPLLQPTPRFRVEAAFRKAEKAPTE
jgi:hypothetical protein